MGLAVMRRLVASGKQVRMVNRSGRGQVPAGVEVTSADVTDPAAARQAFEGAAVVFHCAVGPYGRWPQTLPPIMEGIIQGAAGVGAKLVYGDNLYAYGPVAGPLTEDLPYRPAGPNATVRARLATTLMEAHPKGSVRAAIGRASDFYGPHVHLSTVGDGVFARAVAGKPAQALGNPDTLHTYTFIDDFAAALVTLATRAEALGQVWHVPSAETLTTRQFIEMAFQQTGHPPRVQVAPRMVISVLALFNPTMRGVSESLYQSEKPWVVDHSRYAKAFGASPTPHPEAVAESLKWFREDQGP
ncbi:MAG: NAD-dependent epimerase/dehydratase family protein [Candidatus Dormiibacterota bacterium]